MKKLKLLFLFTIVIFLISSPYSYSHPRYRTCRVYYEKPVHYVKVVKKYRIVKKPKIHQKHYRKVIRKVIYY